MEPQHLKVIVAGGRFFKDYGLLCRSPDHYFGDLRGRTLEIVSGGAPGADRLGEDYARSRGIPIK